MQPGRLIREISLVPVQRIIEVEHQIGVPSGGRYIEKLSSDDQRFGGSEFETLAVVEADPIPAHGKNWSLKLQVPPLGALILEPAR